MRKKKPQRHTPRTPKRLKQPRHKKIEKIKASTMIDASPERDGSVLPVRVNGGALRSKHNLLTPDRLAEEVGGRSELVNMCRLSDAPEAMEFVRKCEVDKEVSLDLILDSMGIRLSKILASVVPALCEYGGQVGRLINAIKSPALMQESIRVGLTAGEFGFADRKMQLEIAGLVEKQKGTTIIGQLNASQGGIERPEATFVQRVDDSEEDDGG
jgi:hypothetical protein